MNLFITPVTEVTSIHHTVTSVCPTEFILIGFQTQLTVKQTANKHIETPILLKLSALLIYKSCLKCLSGFKEGEKA